MLHIDTNEPLHIGYIHNNVFHTVREADASQDGIQNPILKLARPSLTLKLGNFSYRFDRKSIQRFFWCNRTSTVAFEWDYNTGPKIFDENNERTIQNPLYLNMIECNAIMVTVEHPAPKAIKIYSRIYPFYRWLPDVIAQHQHDEKMPEDLPLIVGLYMETLLSMHIPRGRITATFWKTLQDLDIDEAISALILMRNSKTLILNPTQALLNEVRNLRDLDVEKWPSQRAANMQKKNGLVLVFQVDVTPTKIYVTGPFPDQSNRVIRKYWKNRLHFVRLRFTDEDGSQLHGLNDELQTHVFNTLNDGVTLAGRQYKYLAYSNSQLRSHSCFMFAEIDEPNRHVTAEDIISRLGIFPDKSPAKHGARIGQCFTATVGGIRISVNNTQIIKDIQRNGHVFSDGVGTASYAVMELVQKKLAGRYKTPAVPSAIQVRLGGAKGVLSLDNRLNGSAIRLRPSMQKFDSAHKELEITDFAKYRPAFLNRQLITLLLSLGASPSAFRNLEYAMTSGIDELLDGEMNEETLDQLTWGHSKDMLKITAETFGFNDGFLRALINKHSYKALKNLIRKTKIFLPNSALAFGMLDEYSCLEENEVFFQGLTDDGEEIPIVGSVIVHRVPSLHPGDVRVLKAVVRSELSHLFNVIVFSRKGQRPIPNMISGGDLDGDKYSIIGEKSIFPKFTVSPMDYSPSKKTISGKKDSYCREDRMRFFAHFIANDNLGKVANTWQAQCEIQEGGARSKIALTLARVHSTIVDFPKSGISAKLPDNCKTSLYPDYMGKKNSFESQSFIGESYRRLRAKYRDPFQDSDFELEVDEDLSSYPGNEDWLDEAIEIYEQEYWPEMKRLLQDFKASSDVDIITGILPANTQKRKRGKNERTSDQLTRAFEAIKTRFLARFKQGINDSEDKLKKASAWYRAVYERYDEERPAFASFAWILGKYLVRIKEAAIDDRYRRARRRR